MTWYDHETGSIWTQPWGRALVGPLKGTQLRLLPFSLVPWGTWKQEHPGTLALISRSAASRQTAQDNFVAGVTIGEWARAYPYTTLEDAVIVEDDLGEIPLVIHTNPETRSIHIFIAQLPDGSLLTFEGNAERMIDDQTGSIWDPARGLAVEGELTGQALREIPYVTSFDWAWRDFYPHTDFFNG